MADPAQLEQLFQNLLGNAIKYRRPSISLNVEVWAERMEERGEPIWRFVVCDNGIGLDMTHAPHILESFGVRGFDSFQPPRFGHRIQMGRDLADGLETSPSVGTTNEIGNVESVSRGPSIPCPHDDLLGIDENPIEIEQHRTAAQHGWRQEMLGCFDSQTLRRTDLPTAWSLDLHRCGRTP